MIEAPIGSFIGQLYSTASREDRRVIRASEDFYEAVIQSGAYSWLGLFATIDETRQPRVVVYLARRDESLARTMHARSISAELTTLQSTYGAYAPLDVHYLREYEPRDPVHLAQKAIKTRYSTPTHKARAELLWDEAIPIGPSHE